MSGTGSLLPRHTCSSGSDIDCLLPGPRIHCISSSSAQPSISLLVLPAWLDDRCWRTISAGAACAGGRRCPQHCSVQRDVDRHAARIAGAPPLRAHLRCCWRTRSHLRCRTTTHIRQPPHCGVPATAVCVIAFAPRITHCAFRRRPWNDTIALRAHVLRGAAGQTDLAFARARAMA